MHRSFLNFLNSNNAWPVKAKAAGAACVSLEVPVSSCLKEWFDAYRC